METVKPLMDLATGFGSAAPVIGLLLFLLYDERKERRAGTDKIMELIEDSIEAEQGMTKALGILTERLPR